MTDEDFSFFNPDDHPFVNMSEQMEGFGDVPTGEIFASDIDDIKRESDELAALLSQAPPTPISNSRPQTTVKDDGGNFQPCPWCSGYSDGPHEENCEWPLFIAGAWVKTEAEDATSAKQEPSSPTPLSSAPSALVRAPQYHQTHNLRQAPYDRTSLPSGTPGRKTASTEICAHASNTALGRRPTGSAIANVYTQGLPFQPILAPVAETPSVDDEFSTAGMPVFQGYFQSFDAARDAVAPRPDNLVLIHIPEDDVQIVKAQFLSHYAARLFSALYVRPPDAPAHFPSFEAKYFRDHQDAVLRSVRQTVEHDPYKAEARVMLLVEQILDVHEKGIPDYVAARTGKRGGPLFETHKCSARMEKVVLAAQGDKYIAQDILAGESKLVNFVRSPDQYLRRKQENNRNNGMKKQKVRRESEASTVLETPMMPAATPKIGRKRAGEDLDEVRVKRGRLDER